MEGAGRDSERPTDEAENGRIARVQSFLNTIQKHKTYSLVGYVVRRFSRDSCPSVASSLSYTSLLALVPMMAIGLAMFAAFPAFSNMRDTLLRAMIENAAPKVCAQSGSGE